MLLHFSPLFIFFWIAGVAANSALVFVLLYRHRFRQFPVFTLWLAFLVAKSIALMAIYAQGSRLVYTVVYLVGAGVDFALQLGVVLEIARILLRPTGTWIRDARPRFLVGGLAGVAVAAVFTWWINPPAPNARLMWQVRGNLFTSMVICELFIVMTLTATRLGLGWRNHVMAIGQGLTAWSTLMVAKTAFESFLGTQSPYYHPLEQLRNVTYIAAVFWMIVQLWRDEPERRPISTDLNEYILALHRRVEYDLRSLDARH
jgi:hypothetical protein